jgi:hypothetical protein
MEMDKKIDFSQKAINKAILARIIQNPFSIYSIALGGVGLFSVYILLSQPIVFIVAMGLLSAGVMSYFFNFFFRKNTIANQYLDHLNKQLETQKDALLNRLINELAKYDKVEELKNYANQAKIQFNKIKEKFMSFKNMLKDKFNVRELTYARFVGTTEQLYLSVLDNLENISHSLKNANNIDISYIEERFKYLHSLSDPEDADKREIETLTKRKNLRKRQLEKINDLLTINEEAMTQIDMTMASISELKTKASHATMSMENARNDLEDLIKRTQKYSMEI